MKKAILSLISFFLVLTCFQTPFAEAKGKPHVTKEEYLITLLDELELEVAMYEGADVPFSDVSKEAIPYIEAAIRMDILDDTLGAEFGATRPISKEEAYVLLIRALQLEPSNLDVLKKVRDQRQITYPAEVAATLEYGLVVLEKNNKLRPKTKLTRTELTDMFERLDENFERLSIVHTNDLHGRILPNESNGEMGLAKIASIANSVRESNSESLLLDLGDTFHGTNYVNFNEGEAAAEAMNLMGYDAMVAGNHDFNFGYERLVQIAEETLAFPLLSGNVLKTETGDTLFSTHQIVQIHNQKVALIGLTASDTPVKTHPDNIKGLTFTDEVEAAQSLVDQIAPTVDHVFLLTHIGYGVDRQIAEQVEGIDLILGGHSHTTLESPVKVNDTYITQAYEHGKAVGVTYVLFHQGEFASAYGQLIRDYPGLTADPEVENLLDTYKKEVEDALAEVIGTVPERLVGAREFVRTQESNLGNLITDAMRDMTGADIAFTNGGGIRANIEAGDVTKGDVIAAFPFTNTVIALEITGEQLFQSLEHSVRLAPAENGGFLQVSGVQMTYDQTKAPGERIIDLTVNGEPLDKNKTYTVATNDFLAAGGDGYSWLADGTLVIDTGELLSEAASRYIASGQPIPPVEGRIQVVGQ
ncbi:bifunctional UDP-sugar hydrolase/5'-nucleotidase [Halalkalibacterium halodurans]|uniref:Nucleotidase n=4 Tax=Halalkalibacterium halodurans TaxID=86665 RepID=Q9KGN2_HALH5|nr:bifunctional UDP-sugar hydrolase/5'-nucleotidase [Halalkalibacterium halodurans]MED4081715.1 bifunctional UDP-sugar hydrolase/5'-nucleotidase [Halalkalibacterium halodurans]MED4084049.1 bifunctional UDP-sugar hydrolase/5'-nucleotidase [Halalkalibacterium halodurans]MED4105700.1 bifunctional UDP-sugar hydrolase/5'-nucleotidase [Halalkalibacterium halodurans]MED4148674.1 bifunctional UDP-sugar hydrolase/5'-nucleotidase [Halalkalibacterium halodurans]MED4187905.1 bifunctional UDP-sugar hydrola